MQHSQPFSQAWTSSCDVIPMLRPGSFVGIRPLHSSQDWEGREHSGSALEKEHVACATSLTAE